MGYGAISLGYCIDEVDEAAIAQIRNGFMTSLTSPVQTQLAELLVDVIPCAERVHLCKTGSDATAAAVRLARIHTGRDKIVRWGYNGWHDWCSSKTADIPEGVRQDILTFKYNDLNSLEEQFKQYPDQIAAVIMVPLEVISPEEGFLEGVKNLAHKYGALFILDGLREIIKVTGVEAEMIGVDIMPYIIFNYDNAKWISPTGFSGAPVFEPGGKVEKAWRTFYAEATQGGVLLHPNHHWYVGMSHTEQDIDETLNVCETAL